MPGVGRNVAVDLKKYFCYFPISVLDPRLDEIYVILQGQPKKLIKLYQESNYCVLK